MQELITYIIIAASIGYVVFQLVKSIRAKDNSSQCSSLGCSGCGVKNTCNEDFKELKKL